HTLRTAKALSEQHGFTYIALLNEQRFKSAAPFLGPLDSEAIRLKLTDADAPGALFGHHF
ncbi:MAG: hypothetical protein AB8H79_01270, partial [Myxococcota bacterium]